MRLLMAKPYRRVSKRSAIPIRLFSIAAISMNLTAMANVVNSKKMQRESQMILATFPGEGPKGPCSRFESSDSDLPQVCYTDCQKLSPVFSRTAPIPRKRPKGSNPSGSRVSVQGWRGYAPALGIRPNNDLTL